MPVAGAMSPYPKDGRTAKQYRNADTDRVLVLSQRVILHLIGSGRELVRGRRRDVEDVEKYRNRPQILG
jgi:hypothetical protein